MVFWAEYGWCGDGKRCCMDDPVLAIRGVGRRLVLGIGDHVT